MCPNNRSGKALICSVRWSTRNRLWQHYPIQPAWSRAPSRSTLPTDAFCVSLSCHPSILFHHFSVARCISSCTRMFTGAPRCIQRHARSGNSTCFQVFSSSKGRTCFHSMMNGMSRVFKSGVRCLVFKNTGKRRALLPNRKWHRQSLCLRVWQQPANCSPYVYDICRLPSVAKPLQQSWHFCRTMRWHGLCLPRSAIPIRHAERTVFQDTLSLFILSVRFSLFDTLTSVNP